MCGGSFSLTCRIRGCRTESQRTEDRHLGYVLVQRFVDPLLWFRYDHSYEGEKWNDLTNIVENHPASYPPGTEQRPRGLTLDHGRELQMDIRNVRDQLAYSSLYNDSSGAFFTDPRFDNVRNYARPRTIGLVRKRFD